MCVGGRRDGVGGQCKCYCCVSSFDQSPGKVKRIQSGFVWQSGDTGAGEETPGRRMDYHIGAGVAGASDGQFTLPVMRLDSNWP